MYLFVFFFFIYLFIHLFIYSFIYLFIYLFILQSMKIYMCKHFNIYCGALCMGTGAVKRSEMN